MGACRFFFPSLGVWLLLYALGPGLALVLFPGCGFFYMPLGFCLTSPARQSISGFFVWQLIEVSINLVVGGGGYVRLRFKDCDGSGRTTPAILPRRFILHHSQFARCSL